MSGEIVGTVHLAVARSTCFVVVDTLVPGVQTGLGVSPGCTEEVAGIAAWAQEAHWARESVAAVSGKIVDP